MRSPDRFLRDVADAKAGQEAPKRIVEPKDSVEVSDYNPATIPGALRQRISRDARNALKRDRFSSLRLSTDP